jgi:hypothetical protein
MLSFICCIIGFIPVARAAEEKPTYGPNAAQEVLDKAIKQASAEGKHVFLKSGFPECGWCRVFDRYHSFPQVKQILEKYYVIAVIDTSYMPDGKAVFTKFAEPGAPSWVIITADQKSVVDSYENGSNVGYPAQPNEIEWYVKALRKATPSITDPEINTLKEMLQKAAKRDDK